MTAGQDRELEVVAQANTVAGRGGDEIHAVADVLEPFAGRKPGFEITHRLLGSEDPGRGQSGELAPRGVVGEAGGVVEVSVRQADRRVGHDIVRRAPELEQGMEARHLVEGLLAGDRDALDRNASCLDPDPAAAFGIITGHRARLL